jgi:pre-mRNA-splicing factor CWC26
MPINKLDYLSKYLGDEKASKKKAKKRKRSREFTGSAILNDDDVVAPMPNVNDGDEELEEEEGPVVVVEGVIDASVRQISSPLGSWKREGPVRRRQQRHDADASSDPSPARGKHRRRDSSESEGENEKDASSRRTRHELLDESEDKTHVQRRRYDSSNDEGPNDDGKKENACRERHDSSDSESSPAPEQRRRHDSSSSSSEETTSKERMSSGHVAGLQSSDKFSKKESKIQHNRRREAQRTVDKYGMGETVYRDKSGRAVDGPESSSSKKKKQLTKEEQRLLNTGKAQLDEQAQRQKEFERIQQSSFARHVDDEQLEDLRKNDIRPDDPMAAYAIKKQHQQQQQRAAGNVLPQRPVYKGPPAKPNRFGIRPGHRWDARDRGNGFEDKLLNKKYSAQHEAERAYRYSAADM